MSLNGDKIRIYPTIPLEEVFEYKYKKLTDNGNGIEAVLWVPEEGRNIRISAIVISVTGLSEVEIRDFIASETIMFMSFNERFSVPFSPPFLFSLPKNHSLSVKFTALQGTQDCHITVFGVEI